MDKKKQVEPRLGIDFGGVLMIKVEKKGKHDPEYADNFLSSSPSKNVLERIKSLQKKFNGQVWIISKAGVYTEGLIRKWLDTHDFFEYTGLNKDHLIFCRHRKDKGPICEGLGITHFIDDRVHIMQILQGTVPHLFLYGNKEKNHSAKNWTILVEDWDETHDAVVKNLENLKCD
jgi:hypothetical protein